MGHIIPLIPSILSPVYKISHQGRRGEGILYAKFQDMAPIYSYIVSPPPFNRYVNVHTPGSSNWVNYIVHTKSISKSTLSRLILLKQVLNGTAPVCNYQVKALQVCERHTLRMLKISPLSLILIVCIHSAHSASQKFLYPT